MTPTFQADPLDFASTMQSPSIGALTDIRHDSNNFDRD
jgi:hypothetical protein